MKFYNYELIELKFSILELEPTVKQLKTISEAIQPEKLIYCLTTDQKQSLLNRKHGSATDTKIRHCILRRESFFKPEEQVLDLF